MANIQKFQTPVRVGNFASAPSDVSAGAIYWDTGAGALYVANGSSYSQLAISTNTFLDSLFRIQDNGDTSKQLAFEVSNISTATTRTITMPDSNVNLALVATAIQRDGSVAFTANQPMGGFKLTGLGAGSGAGDSVRYEQAILISGANAFAANQPMGGFKLTGLGAGSTAGDSVRYEQVILRDGSQAFTAAQSMGGFKLTNVADPTSAQDAATKNYVDNLQNGLSWKQSVRAASTADVDISSELENGDVLDGVTLATGDRVLLKDQTAPEENGIYVVAASGAASRSSDMNTWAEVPAAAAFIEEGTVNGDTAYVCTSDQGGTIGVDPITFVLFASTTSFVGGDGIDISGNVISVDHDGQGLTFVSNQLALELDGSTLSKSASGLKVATGGISNNEVNASAAIAYSKLNLSNSIVNADINASAAIAYSKLNLSGSIVNADINASAAIAYSKLNLSASIVNADIAAAAAIAYSKLAALTTGRALQSNASTGFIEVSSVTNTELGYLSGVTSAIQSQIDAKVTGPASATDNAIARYDGTSGKLVQDSLASVSDTGGMTIQDTFLRGDGSSSNVVEEEYVHNATLTSSTTAVLSNFTFDSRVYKSLQVDYMVKNGNDRRTGILMVVCNNASGVAASVTSLTDSSTETADINLSWAAAVNGNNIEVSYTTSSGTYRINADLKRFQAN